MAKPKTSDRKPHKQSGRKLHVETTTGKRTHCPACGHEQDDRGMRTTCVRCGMEPIYSYSYPKTSPCHPRNAGKAG